MEMDPRAALDRLIEALTAHLEAATATQDSESAAVLRAADLVEETFNVYDDTLYALYEIDVPLGILEDFDDLDDDDDDEDEDDDYDDDDEDEDDDYDDDDEDEDD